MQNKIFTFQIDSETVGLPCYIMMIVSWYADSEVTDVTVSALHL